MNIIETEKTNLPGLAENYKKDGYRIVQIHCTQVSAGFELNYSFAKENELENVRLVLAEGEEIDSISNIFWSAFLYENEIHDLFGVDIRNIVLNYNGNLYKVAKQAPFKKETKEEQK